MDNKTINEIAAQIAQNYETAEVPMYGQRLCLPDRASVIAILELLQKLLFPAYFGDTQLLRLPPAQYSALLLQELAEKLTEQIVSGQLAAGEKVPPVRELAAQAGVNPNTMQRALAEMEREGLMFTNRTSGRYVTEDREMIGKVREQIAGERITEFLSGMSQLGFTEQDIVALLEKRSGEEKNNG